MVDEQQQGPHVAIVIGERSRDEAKRSEKRRKERERGRDGERTNDNINGGVKLDQPTKLNGHCHHDACACEQVEVLIWSRAHTRSIWECSLATPRNVGIVEISVCTCPHALLSFVLLLAPFQQSSNGFHHHQN